MMRMSMVSMMAVLLLVFAATNAIEVDAVEVHPLEAEGGLEDGVEAAPAEMDMSRIHDAMDTISLIEMKAKGKSKNSFNVFGFLGCCYHCKHDPSCTEQCMARHHIANGSEQAEEETSVSQTRLLRAAEAVAFVQQAAGYHKHKPIKLDLAQGSRVVHAAPAAPQKSWSPGAAEQKASATLNSESDSQHSFRIHEFFHCAFSCEHKPSCEKKCLSRHHISMTNHEIKQQNMLMDHTEITTENVK